MTFRAVVFDYFGTLTPGIPQHVWSDHAEMVGKALGVTGAAMQDLLHVTFPERATGALGDLPATIETLAKRLGIIPTSAQLEQACRIRTTTQLEVFRPRTEAAPVVAQLCEEGFRVGLVSDCTCELPVAWRSLPLAELIEAPVFSCDLGVRKPDRRLFLAAAQQLDITPHDCLYVGDGGGDELSGAAAVGMTPVLFADSDWETAAVYDRQSGWDGRRISDLRDVLALARGS